MPLMEKQTTEPDVAEAASRFAIPGDFAGAARWGNGHINDTFAVTFEGSGNFQRYILQRINRHVFKDGLGVMSNIELILSHIQARLTRDNEPDLERKVLRLISARDGSYFYKDENDYYWRAYYFIERTEVYDVVADPRIARESAAAFGRIQRHLSDFPVEKLCETIPLFHNTPNRFRNLENAIKNDSVSRVAGVREDIDFAVRQERLVHTIQKERDANRIPLRVAHNDTKVNNILFDAESKKGICVVDLDLVMPAIGLYDFGGLVRTACSTGAEDEYDLTKIDFNLSLFRPLVEGYYSEAKSFLTKEEEKYLALIGIVHTYEDGIRFLTDYLEGDHYYRIHHPTHNLVRARTQFKLVKRMLEIETQLEKIVEDVISRSACSESL
jgi:Ser/Thr protein kinase RdoA (MazF antagonist)